MPKPEKIKKFWNFQKISDAVTEVLIYDYIAMYNTTDWWTGEKSEEVTPKAFKAELDAVGTPEVCVRINSGGGDIVAAVNISTIIKECRESGKKVTCKIDGICASAAVQIALACEKIAIPSSAYIMIHNPMTILWGYYQATELSPVIDTLGKMRDGILNAYTERTGLSEDELIKMMDPETWMTGKDAVEKGFADELMFTQVKTEVVEDEENDMKNFFINGARFDFAAYHKTPKAME